MEPKLREAKCRGKGFATYPAGRRRLREDKVPLPLLDERGLARAEMAAGVPLHQSTYGGNPCARTIVMETPDKPESKQKAKQLTRERAMLAASISGRLCDWSG